MSTQFVDLRPGVSRTFLDTFFYLFFTSAVFARCYESRENSLISSVSRAYSETITTTRGERVCDAKLLIKWVAASRGNDQSLRESAAMEFHIISSLQSSESNICVFLYSRDVSEGESHMSYGGGWGGAENQMKWIEFHLAIVDDKIMSLLAFLVSRGSSSFENHRFRVRSVHRSDDDKPLAELWVRE